MAKSENSGNKYDRILKENSSALVLRYLMEEWDWDWDNMTSMPTKYSRTLEREVDYLYKVPDKQGNYFLLHLEFQTSNDGEMLERMQEYHAILYREYGLTIKHVLIYLGKDKMRMQSKLPRSAWFTGFDTISLREMDSDKLLSSQVPEVLILAILAHPGTEPPEQVLRLVIDKLYRLVDHPDKRRKYLTQLLIMSGLRESYRVALKKIRTDMPMELDIVPEEDFMYQLAVEEWKQKMEAFKLEVEQKLNLAEQKAEEAKRKAEQKAEEAKRKAEQKAEEAKRKAEQKAEEAKRKAEQKAEEAERKAEQKAEEAERKAEQKAEEAERKAEQKAEEAERKAKREQAIRMASKLLENGMEKRQIADILECSLEELEKLLAQRD